MSGLAGVTAQVKTIAASLLVGFLLLPSLGIASDRSIASRLVQPANADTIFDYVLVFPADADDQVLEAWRQRALDVLASADAQPTTCTPQVVRFHVAASWQLPMLGVRCIDGLAEKVAVPAMSGDTHDVRAPVWLANTSVNTVRGQVAAMLQ